MIDRGQLIEKFEKGEVRALARVISWVENSGGVIPSELQSIFSNTGRAFRIGITGPPGAGKSTLVDGLAKLCRADGKTVGILAVDPSSPFSGGALLGDRVRMNQAGLDPGIFIRSMATRGSLGGLAETTLDAADVLDAFGKDIVIMETVGVGQSELDIAQAADITVVVLVPESGDGVQAMKAGLMEIGDVFILNKADRPNADQAVFELQSALELKRKNRVWEPPVLATQANKGKGLPEVWQTLKEYQRSQEEKGTLEARRLNRRRERIKQIAESELRRRFWTEERQAALEKALTAGENIFNAANGLVDGGCKG